MPCIILFKGLFRPNMTTPARNGTIVKIKKNPENPTLSAILSEYSAMIEASFPDNPMNKYQIPKMNPSILAGANLLTYDKPTGEMHNSPKVWNRYTKISQIILTEAVCAPGGIDNAPITNIPNPNARKVKPPKNF